MSTPAAEVANLQDHVCTHLLLEIDVELVQVPRREVRVEREQLHRRGEAFDGRRFVIDEREGLRDAVVHVVHLAGRSARVVLGEWWVLVLLLEHRRGHRSVEDAPTGSDGCAALAEDVPRGAQSRREVVLVARKDRPWNACISRCDEPLGRVGEPSRLLALAEP